MLVCLGVVWAVQADETFPGNACIPCREFLKSLQRQLAQISRDTFFEFEVAVEKDSTRTPVADGTVHPLTSYVINYVKFLFEYVTSTSLQAPILVMLLFEYV